MDKNIYGKVMDLHLGGQEVNWCANDSQEGMNSQDYSDWMEDLLGEDGALQKDEWGLSLDEDCWAMEFTPLQQLNQAWTEHQTGLVQQILRDHPQDDLILKLIYGKEGAFPLSWDEWVMQSLEESSGQLIQLLIEKTQVLKSSSVLAKIKAPLIEKYHAGLISQDVFFRLRALYPVLPDGTSSLDQEANIRFDDAKAMQMKLLQAVVGRRIMDIRRLQSQGALWAIKRRGEGGACLPLEGAFKNAIMNCIKLQEDAILWELFNHSPISRHELMEWVVEGSDNYRFLDQILIMGEIHGTHHQDRSLMRLAIDQDKPLYLELLQSKGGNLSMPMGEDAISYYQYLWMTCQPKCCQWAQITAQGNTPLQ